MTRIAVLMPTRNRASTAARAVSSFLASARDIAETTVVRVCVVDDSDDPSESEALAGHLDAVRSANRMIPVDLVRRVPATPPGDMPSVGGGPGGARNEGLRHLRSLPRDHDVLLMFDDDVCFAAGPQQGFGGGCDSATLLHEALRGCRTGRTVVGCDYLGRQDLSILEHAHLDDGETAADGRISPAVARQDVTCVAPGGISTAFLAVSASAHDVPDFPEHYNEDYLWLHRLAKRGWSLHKASEPLLHAPPGDIAVTVGSLTYQVFGEIVWLAVLEADTFPVENRLAIAAAVEEIAGDLRKARDAGRVRSDPSLMGTVCQVLQYFERVRDDIGSGVATPDAARLLSAITLGLRYCSAEG